MSFPNYSDKQREAALFNPKQYLAYLKSVGKYPNCPVPEGVVLCYSPSLLGFARNRWKTKQGDQFLADLCLLSEANCKIGIFGGFGVGAPTMAIFMEELVAFGVRKFISVGTAGTLQHSISVGDVVLCDRAIRDEGTSHHYLPPAKFSHASSTLLEPISELLHKKAMHFTVGQTWTVDTPYRETIAEARQYQSEGVATVDMEAAALYAVAQYRGVEALATFAISDSLAELKWNPRFHDPKTQKSCQNLLEAAVDALSNFCL